MGRPRPNPPDPVQTFFGESEAFEGNPAKLSEAFESAAGKLIEAKLIGPDAPDPTATVWLQVTTLEVELGNQHPKTVRVGVTPIPPSS
jgi:hypothetical protein